MKKIKSLIIFAWNNEALKYLFFGGLTTLVYLISRITIFYLTELPELSTVTANAIALLFAFFTNDIWVFNQKRSGWFKRFIKFTSARLTTLVLDFAMTWFFVKTYPHIVGQFVNDDIHLVDTIVGLVSQVLIILLNYIFSKLFVFDNSKKA
ncbi:GtrA family protein [Streptococcus dentapri]|uniref:GtrA family protein n=1 Tax=Streptococcus dentapri TaxID=573564 RepID=A0ABV8CZG5_9STRE